MLPGQGEQVVCPGGTSSGEEEGMTYEKVEVEWWGAATDMSTGEQIPGRFVGVENPRRVLCDDAPSGVIPPRWITFGMLVYCGMAPHVVTHETIELIMYPRPPAVPVGVEGKDVEPCKP